MIMAMMRVLIMAMRVMIQFVCGEPGHEKRSRPHSGGAASAGVFLPFLLLSLLSHVTVTMLVDECWCWMASCLRFFLSTHLCCLISPVLVVCLPDVEEERTERNLMN